MDGKNRSFVCEIMKEKGICASSAAILQTAKVTVTVRGKYLVKTEKTLHLYSKIFWERETIFT